MGLICTPVVIRSFEHHTVRIFSVFSGVSEAYHLSSPSTNITRGHTARRLWRKRNIHLQTSMPSPGFEPRPYSTTVSVTNHYTGWAAMNIM
ncbi:hypothetical protein TNCV_3825551 [Trichonephila clavipes]|nr:hypothetical protein TNCV_3825551 [Trichonephila clavipes]